MAEASRTAPEGAYAARLAPVITGLSLLTFAALKSYGFHYGVSDENIYFYTVDRLSDDARLYVDIFHAHPPLHLLPMSLVTGLIGGFSFTLARLVPMAAVMVAGLFLYRMGRRRHPIEAALACMLFVFSFDVLRVSTHFTGSNLAVMWTAIGLERLCRGRDVQSAAAFTAGSFTLLNVAPAAAGAGLLLLVADPRRGLRFAALGTGFFGLSNLAAFAAWGTPFLEQVYLFHLGKSGVAGGHAANVLSILTYNIWLFGGGALGLLVLMLSPSSPGSNDARAAGFRERILLDLPILAPLAAAVASAIFLASLARVFTYYFEVMLLCIAPLAAHGLAGLIRSLRDAHREPSPERLGVAAGLLAFFLVTQLPGTNLLRDDGGPMREHAWKGSGVAPLDTILRALLWKDESRAGLRYRSWTEYLWHEADHFESALPMAARVRETTREDETVFGSSTAAPLIALLAERRLAFDQPDTNVMRFTPESGAAGPLIQMLDDDPPAWVIDRVGHGIFTLPEFARWRDARYAEPEEFLDEPAARRLRLYPKRSQ